MFVIQYQFNVSVSSPLASINTNFTLLALSSSPTMKVTESTTDTNSKPAMGADAAPGKKNLCKSLYTMNLHLNMHLDILKKMDRYLTDISNLIHMSQSTVLTC